MAWNVHEAESLFFKEKINLLWLINRIILFLKYSGGEKMKKLMAGKYFYNGSSSAIKNGSRVLLLKVLDFDACVVFDVASQNIVYTSYSNINFN